MPSDNVTPELFATWSGHRHPLRPQSPITLGDIPALKVFYLATFAGEGAGRRLMVFEKFRVRGRPLPVSLVTAESAGAYVALDAGSGNFRPGPPATEHEALAAGRWIWRPVPGQPAAPQLVETERESSSRYTYDSNGEVETVSIEDALGPRVISAKT